MDYKKDIEVADKLISKLIYYVEIEEGSIDALCNCIASHKALGEAKDEILEIPCIQCDGSGSYADDEGEEAQCQFCYEIRFPFRDLVAKLKLERDEADKDAEKYQDRLLKETENNIINKAKIKEQQAEIKRLRG